MWIIGAVAVAVLVMIGVVASKREQSRIAGLRARWPEVCDVAAKQRAEESHSTSYLLANLRMIYEEIEHGQSTAEKLWSEHQEQSNVALYCRVLRALGASPSGPGPSTRDAFAYHVAGSYMGAALSLQARVRDTAVLPEVGAVRQAHVKHEAGLQEGLRLLRGE